MYKFYLFILIGLIILFFHNCSPNLKIDEGKNIDIEILKEMEKNQIPSITACIIKENEIVWKKAYGKANIKNDVAATTETLYTLMSVSKLVIVTAVMQLHEQGLIDLDGDINEYLPFSVRNPHFHNQKITSRMLLTHTSGLIHPESESLAPNFYKNFPYDTVPLLKEWLNEYFTNFNSIIWKKTAPGELDSYSNIGAALMAYVVEVITNVDYNEYCKSNIFQPLNMPNTSHRFIDLDISNVAVPYQENYRPFYHYSHRDYPAGFLRSSIEEFSHFIIAYINNGEYMGKRILKENTTNEILTIQNPANGRCLLWNCNFGDWYGHGGGAKGGGYTTQVDIQREDKVGLIIFSNYSCQANASIWPGGKIYGLIRTKTNEYR